MLKMVESVFQLSVSIAGIEVDSRTACMRGQLSEFLYLQTREGIGNGIINIPNVCMKISLCCYKKECVNQGHELWGAGKTRLPHICNGFIVTIE